MHSTISCLWSARHQRWPIPLCSAYVCVMTTEPLTPPLDSVAVMVHVPAVVEAV